MKIGILASGKGSNAQAIMDRIAAGVLHASVEIVLSNRADAQVLDRARKAGVKSMTLDRRSFATRKEYDAALADLLRQHGCELVVLAGYMLVLGKNFLDAFPGRVINIHPSLLPSFPGTHGAESALAHGVKLTGPTVHFVEEEIDTGPIIIQAAAPVMAGEDADSLKNRIHALEHRIYPQSIQWLAEDRIRVEGRQVFLEPGSRKSAPRDGDWLVWPPLEEGF